MICKGTLRRGDEIPHFLRVLNAWFAFYSTGRGDRIGSDLVNCCGDVFRDQASRQYQLRTLQPARQRGDGVPVCRLARTTVLAGLVAIDQDCFGEAGEGLAVIEKGEQGVKTCWAAAGHNDAMPTELGAVFWSLIAMQLDHIELQLGGCCQNSLEAGVHEESDATDRIWNRLDNRIGLIERYITPTFREEVEADGVGAGLNGLPAVDGGGDSTDLDAKHRLLTVGGQALFGRQGVAKRMTPQPGPVRPGLPEASESVVYPISRFREDQWHNR